jgi:hypothetical protein
VTIPLGDVYAEKGCVSLRKAVLLTVAKSPTLYYVDVNAVEDERPARPLGLRVEPDHDRAGGAGRAFLRHDERRREPAGDNRDLRVHPWAPRPRLVATDRGRRRLDSLPAPSAAGRHHDEPGGDERCLRGAAA